MAGPTTPLTPSDPYADGVAAVRTRAAEMRAQGEELRRTAQALLARVGEVPWQGRAAETMATRARERAERLGTLAQAHDRAAAALERHADAVAAVGAPDDPRGGAAAW